jgi:hypothetical protein
VETPLLTTHQFAQTMVSEPFGRVPAKVNQTVNPALYLVNGSDSFQAAAG